MSANVVLHRPNDVSHVATLLRDLGPTARLHAGGTDLVVQMRSSDASPDHLVDLGRVSGIAGIRVAPESVWIDAMATLALVIAHPVVRGKFPALIDAAMLVGSTQIQARATLAGNVCNASPAADTVPALQVHDASVLVIGPHGEHLVPIGDFATGPRQTVLRPGEPQIDPPLFFALVMGVVAFTILYIALVRRRISLAEAEDAIAAGMAAESVAGAAVTEPIGGDR